MHIYELRFDYSNLYEHTFQYVYYNKKKKARKNAFFREIIYICDYRKIHYDTILIIFFTHNYYTIIFLIRIFVSKFVHELNLLFKYYKNQVLIFFFKPYLLRIQ